MKYCTKCGNQLEDEAVVCYECGCSTDDVEYVEEGPKRGTTAVVFTSIFMVLGIIGNLANLTLYVSEIIGIVSLLWTIPMTIIYLIRIKRNEPISLGFKVCSLLFVSGIAGIIMLCQKD